MTRKHFILIAGVIASYTWSTTDEQRLYAEHMADALATTNSQFDRNRFIEAATK